MRYMLTLVNVHNDDLDGVDIEAASAEGLWGEVYPGGEADPVEVITTAAAVFDEVDALRALLDAAEVGLDGIDDPERREAVASVLASFREQVA